MSVAGAAGVGNLVLLPHLSFDCSFIASCWLEDRRNQLELYCLINVNILLYNDQRK